MDVYEAVVSRLAMLGYQATEDDKPAIDYLTGKCRVALLASIHHKDVPDGLIYTLVDMVAGSFLQDKLAAGDLEIEGMDFSAGAAKSITEGDVSITFAGASDGTATPEARFLATLDGMVHPPEKILGAFRRLKW
ncbi:hypothetical protein AALA83_06405 [Oscillospiraceae bacterium 44-5]